MKLHVVFCYIAIGFYASCAAADPPLKHRPTFLEVLNQSEAIAIGRLGWFQRRGKRWEGEPYDQDGVFKILQVYRGKELGGEDGFVSAPRFTGDVIAQEHLLFWDT